MTQYELVQARRYLQQDVLALRRVEGLSATTVKIVWDVSTIKIICDMGVIVLMSVIINILFYCRC